MLSLGERQALGVIDRNVLMNWSERPHVYWVDIEWSRYHEVQAWLDAHDVLSYESLLPGFNEFIISDDLLRVDFQLRFC